MYTNEVSHAKEGRPCGSLVRIHQKGAEDQGESNGSFSSYANQPAEWIHG
jgi:hypothetical protein